MVYNETKAVEIFLFGLPRPSITQNLLKIYPYKMLFAFIFSLVPLLVAAETAVPNAKGKFINTFKPESWMLKPLSPSDEHYKPPSKSVSSYVDQYTYWLSTFYYSSSYCNNDEIIMKTAVPTGSCMQTGEYSSIIIYCYSGNNFNLICISNNLPSVNNLFVIYCPQSTAATITLTVTRTAIITKAVPT